MSNSHPVFSYHTITHLRSNPAIHNYQEVKEQRVQLTVGEYVHILKENSDWYFGYAKKDKSVLGIFPKSFVHIKDPSNVEVTW